MLIIRLSRQGKSKEPYFRLIVSEKTKDTVGDYLESLGFYDPRKKVLNLKEERVKYWISKGAQASGTVHNLLVSKGVIVGKKVKKGGRKKIEADVKPAGEAGSPPKAAEPAVKETVKEEVKTEDKKAGEKA